MVLPRTSAFGSMFRSSVTRTARLRSSTHAWRMAGRRTYASDHGPAKKSSDIPWLIGSLVVTIPSAAWLLQQGPKGEHGHGHDGHKAHEQHAESKEKPKDDSSDEGKDEGEETPKDDAEAKPDDGDKDESGEKGDSSDDSESKGDQSSDEGGETPATSDDEAATGGQKRKAKGQKLKEAETPKSETQEEKGKNLEQAKGDVSGASNPYLADPKKGEGIKDSARIHGTVDPQRNVRGPGDGEKPKDLKDDKPTESSKG